MKKSKMTYAGVGVDYDIMDPFKRMAQKAGRETADNLKQFGFTEVEASRGESAYLIEADDHYLAHVEEGLGTKNLVADEMHKLTGICSYYDWIAHDTLAMIVNDMITLGALPFSVAMHLAVGSSDWLKNEARCRDLIEGWKKACNLAGAVWAGGETPTLKDIILPNAAVLAGSAMGIIKPKSRRFDPSRIEEGDAIIFLGSSGIHANGLTMARQIAAELPDGYLTELYDGRTFGETLLAPTHIYVPFIRTCLKLGIDIHYAVNITGHGWRKLMRAPQPLAYVINCMPEPQPIFSFIQEHGPMSDEEAYGNLNMGAGFAIYMAEREAQKLFRYAENGSFGEPPPYEVWRAGYIAPCDRRKVAIKAKDLEFDGETLGVR